MKLSNIIFISVSLIYLLFWGDLKCQITYNFKFKERSDSSSVARLVLRKDSTFSYYTKIGKLTFSDSGKYTYKNKAYYLTSYTEKPSKRKFNNTCLNILKNKWLQIRVNDCLTLGIPDFGGFFIPEKKSQNNAQCKSVAFWDTSYIPQIIENMEIIPFYQFPDPYYKSLLDIESFWVKTYFNDIIKSFNLKLDCDGCSKIYIDAVFYVGSDGKVLDYEVIDERVCGGMVVKGLAEKMIEYFKNIQYPDIVKGKGILFVIGNGLKC